MQFLVVNSGKPHSNQTHLVAEHRTRAGAGTVGTLRIRRDGVLVLLEETACITDLIADEVVEEPHRRGRAVEALALEDRIELILLALIVYWDTHAACHKAPTTGS